MPTEPAGPTLTTAGGCLPPPGCLGGQDALRPGGNSAPQASCTCSQGQLSGPRRTQPVPCLSLLSPVGHKGAHTVEGSRTSVGCPKGLASSLRSRACLAGLPLSFLSPHRDPLHPQVWWLQRRVVRSRSCWPRRPGEPARQDYHLRCWPFRPGRPHTACLLDRDEHLWGQVPRGPGLRLPCDRRGRVRPTSHCIPPQHQAPV